MSKRKRIEGTSVMDFFTSARHSQTSSAPATLIAFYEGNGTDARGRHLSDILRWGVRELESSHDYIQTLFPLPERSGINDRAPVIDAEVFEAFRSREDLRDKLRDAFRKILWFYGFEIGTNGAGRKVTIIKGHNHAQHSQNWLTRFDHNHLRITRIIRCLRVLGLEEEALAFYNVISSATMVSARSRMYWERAAHRPLNIRPDVDDGNLYERLGPRFLREFEQARLQESQPKVPVEEEESTAAPTTRKPDNEDKSLNDTEGSKRKADAVTTNTDPKRDDGTTEDFFKSQGDEEEVAELVA